MNNSNLHKFETSNHRKCINKYNCHCTQAVHKHAGPLTASGISLPTLLLFKTVSGQKFSQIDGRFAKSALL